MHYKRFLMVVGNFVWDEFVKTMYSYMWLLALDLTKILFINYFCHVSCE